MKLLRSLALIATTLLFLSGCKPIVDNMAFYPDTVNIVPTDRLPVGVEEVFIQTEDNVKIQCLYLPVADSKNILIYFHGNAGNIFHRLPDLIRLQRFGINVVGVSYRGYGNSEGSPSEAGIYKDAKAAYHYVTRKLGFSADHVYIMGRSIGTTAAVEVAQNKSLAGLVLVTPLTSAAAQARASGMGVVSSLAGDAFDNLSKIDNVKSPLLVIHGTHDRVIPFAMGQEIYDKAHVEKQFIKIEGAGHNDIHDKYSQSYWPPIFEFIKSTAR